jgi:hypothetical protein
VDGDVTAPTLLFPCSNTAQIPSLQILQAWYALYEADQGILVQHVSPLAAWTPWYTKNYNGSRYALSTSTHCNGVPTPGHTSRNPMSKSGVSIYYGVQRLQCFSLNSTYHEGGSIYPPSPYTPCVPALYDPSTHGACTPSKQRHAQLHFRWTTQLTDMLGTLFSMLN